MMISLSLRGAWAALILFLGVASVAQAADEARPDPNRFTVVQLTPPRHLERAHDVRGGE
jgi:hypothetical protein